MYNPLFILLITLRRNLVLYCTFLCMYVDTCSIWVHLPVCLYLEPDDDRCHESLIKSITLAILLNLGTALQVDWLAGMLPSPVLRVCVCVLQVCAIKLAFP